VASAQDALDSIAQTLPDFLLSDVAMPNENGYALMRRVRTTVDAGRLPAAALSAYVDGDSREQALDAGFRRICPNQSSRRSWRQRSRRCFIAGSPRDVWALGSIEAGRRTKTPATDKMKTILGANGVIGRALSRASPRR